MSAKAKHLEAIAGRCITLLQIYTPQVQPSGGRWGALVIRLKRANVCWPMVFDGGFRFREADAETDGKCHRGQARRARQEPDGQRFEREIRVFPALAQTYTKKDKGYGLDACLGESVGFMERSDSGTE